MNNNTATGESAQGRQDYEHNVSVILQDVDSTELLFFGSEDDSGGQQVNKENQQPAEATTKSSTSTDTGGNSNSNRDDATSSSATGVSSALENFSNGHSTSETVGSLLRTAVHPLDLRYRPVPGGRQVAYVANDIIISKANEIFGFNGWRCEIKGLHTDFCDQTRAGTWNIGISAHMRVTVSDSSFHEDIGWGAAENVRSREKAIEKAKKQAITDARKRCLRLFGDALGNCVRNEDYQKEVVQTNRQRRQQTGSAPTVQRFTSEELLGAPTAHPSVGYNQTYNNKDPQKSSTTNSTASTSNAVTPQTSGWSSIGASKELPNSSTPYGSVSAPNAVAPQISGRPSTGAATSIPAATCGESSVTTGTPSCTKPDEESSLQNDKQLSEEEKKEIIRKRRELAKQRLEERKRQGDSIATTGTEDAKRGRVS